MVEGREVAAPSSPRAPVSAPWWPPRRGREEWEIVAPCSVPPPNLPLSWKTNAALSNNDCSDENYQRLLSFVPPPAWPSEKDARRRNEDAAGKATAMRGRERGKGRDDENEAGGLVLSGAFMKQLALNEKRRKERKRREAQQKSSTAMLSNNIQSLLERRREFEKSEALEDVLKRRQELRDFREDIYGLDELTLITDMEDQMNESFDGLCASMQAPAWPTPRI